MKVVLAGAGAFGQKHLDAIKLIGGIEVASLVGRDLEATRATAAKYGVGHATTDLAERKRIWQGIEKYFVEEGYMMKIADIADLRATNAKFEGIKPYYMQRFWDVWAK